jgi:hypothetical protein
VTADRSRTGGEIDCVLPAVEIVLNAVIVIATVCLAYYAKVTVDEGKKNRRKDVIESKLREAYSPLYEILRRAHIDDGVRNAVRQISPTKEFVFREDEYARLSSIVETFGHHLGSQERMAFTNSLREDRQDRADVRNLGDGTRWYRFARSVMENHYMHVWRTCQDLMKELDALIKT